MSLASVSGVDRVGDVHAETATGGTEVGVSACEEICVVSAQPLLFRKSPAESTRRSVTSVARVLGAHRLPPPPTADLVPYALAFGAIAWAILAVTTGLWGALPN